MTPAGAASASSWPPASMVTETPAPRPSPSVWRRETFDMPALPFGCHATLCGRQNAAPKAPPQAFAKRIAASRSWSGSRKPTHLVERRGLASPRLRGEGFGFAETSGAKRSGGEGAVPEEAPGPSRSASFVTAPLYLHRADFCAMEATVPRVGRPPDPRRGEVARTPSGHNRG